MTAARGLTLGAPRGDEQRSLEEVAAGLVRGQQAVDRLAQGAVAGAGLAEV